MYEPSIASILPLHDLKLPKSLIQIQRFHNYFYSVKEIQVTTEKFVTVREGPGDGKRRENILRVGPLNSGVFLAHKAIVSPVLCPGVGIQSMSPCGVTGGGESVSHLPGQDKVRLLRVITPHTSGDVTSSQLRKVK